ncbi:AAA domain-containing protein [Pavlovales sp. CCMP2436]|nr:AAA domain-containing protein [Pavlovales sp. CCMP2436]
MGCERLVLVGDPQQLPATVFSAHAADAGYERSLFERLQQSGHRTHLLRTQYRMHPEISHFPAKVFFLILLFLSTLPGLQPEGVRACPLGLGFKQITHFYSGRLNDASEVLTNRARQFHSLRLFSPYSFVDVADGVAERTNAASWRNDSEARLIVAIVRYLATNHPEIVGEGCESVGVVSPYNGQVKHVRALLKEELGAAAVAKLTVNSVDGFQGREKEVRFCFSRFFAFSSSLSPSPSLLLLSVNSVDGF